MKSLPNLTSITQIRLAIFLPTFTKLGPTVQAVFLILKQEFKVAEGAKIFEGFYGKKQELPKRKKFQLFYMENLLEGKGSQTCPIRTTSFNKAECLLCD